MKLYQIENLLALIKTIIKMSPKTEIENNIIITTQASFNTYHIKKLTLLCNKLSKKIIIFIILYAYYLTFLCPNLRNKHFASSSSRPNSL